MYEDDWLEAAYEDRWHLDDDHDPEWTELDPTTGEAPS